MTTNQTERKREYWIDCVKCIAILVVLLNHAQLVFPGVNFLGGMFFVPVFFVLSGYTYHAKEISFGDMARGKAKRLLVPYAVANAILVGIFVIKDILFCAMGRQAIGEVGFDIAMKVVGSLYARNQIFVSGMDTLLGINTENPIPLYTAYNSPTWFLPALFVTILVFDLLYRKFEGNWKRILLANLVLLVVAVLYHYIVPVLLPWSLDCIPMFLLLYLLGYVLATENVLQKLCQKPAIILVLMLVFSASAFVNGSANFSIRLLGKSVTLALLNAGISSVLILLLCYAIAQKREKTSSNEIKIKNPLAFVGRHTLFILCYHYPILVVGVAVIDRIVSMLGLSEIAGSGGTFVTIALKLLLILATAVILAVIDQGKEAFYAKKRSA